MAQSEGSPFKQKPFTMSKYDASANFLEAKAESCDKMKMGELAANFREAAALLRQQGEERKPPPVLFAKYLLMEFRSCWIDEINAAGWQEVHAPYKEYSTEGAYHKFLAEWQASSK
jgi:hypothetical protein